MQINKPEIITDILANFYWGTRYHSWLRHYATSLKVTGSIPDEVIEIFN
jgi:hypothetical protein